MSVCFIVTFDLYNVIVLYSDEHHLFHLISFNIMIMLICITIITMIILINIMTIISITIIILINIITIILLLLFYKTVSLLNQK